jgi:hypothetical protein
MLSPPPYCGYADFVKGDLFVADPIYDGSIGRVISVSAPRGSPSCVEVEYLNLADDHKMFAAYNAAHVTKYLRPGERFATLNMGRG